MVRISLRSEGGEWRRSRMSVVAVCGSVMRALNVMTQGHEWYSLCAGREKKESDPVLL